MAPQGDDQVYHPVDSLRAGTLGAMATGGAGLFSAAIQNAMRKQNVGALAVFTKSGGAIFTWGTSNPALYQLKCLQLLRLTCSSLAI